MREVKELVVTQIRLFHPGRLPYHVLRSQKAQDWLKGRFGFESAVTTPSDVIVFMNGLVPFNEERVVVVRSLQVEERKLVVEVEGDSEVATKVYEETKAAFAEVRPEDDLADLEPVVLTEETSCVATLDLEWSDLFPKALTDFLTKDLVPATTTDFGKSEINAAKVGVDLRFVTGEELRENKVTLSNKLFTLEPRPQEAFSKHRFRCVSPLGSTQHLRLLRKLEKALRRKK